MSDRRIKVLENDRYVTRGVSQANRRLYAVQAEAEVQKYVLDFTAWLDGDTIADVNLDARGVTAAESHTTTVVTLTLSAARGDGLCRVQITTTTSQETKEVPIYTRGRDAAAFDDYGMCA